MQKSDNWTSDDCSSGVTTAESSAFDDAHEGSAQSLAICAV
jgi:hypothetical protein